MADLPLLINRKRTYLRRLFSTASGKHTGHCQNKHTDLFSSHTLSSHILHSIILKIIHNFKTFKRPVQISSPIIVRDRPQLCQHVFLNRKCIQLFYTRIHDV